jgi:cysteine-rich repeat protein
VIGGEGCDDSNTADGDGCSRICQPESCAGVALDASPPCDGSTRLFCGDGIVTPDEECDCGDGRTPLPQDCPASNGDATYDGCTTQCKWGPHCGDGVVNGAEECDFGNRNGFDVSDDGCTWTCTRPPHCGDGRVDLLLYEECDLGPLNGVILDSDLKPVVGSGHVYCSYGCTVPLI